MTIAAANPRRLLAFLAEIDRIKSVLRRSPLTDRSRRENSAEHSWRCFDPRYGAANAGRRNQLLGSPMPEQKDLRLDAVVDSEFLCPVSRLGHLETPLS